MRRFVAAGLLATLMPLFGVPADATLSDGSHRVPPGFSVGSVTFISSSQGWVLGSYRCDRHPCTALIRTTDGGIHWRRLDAPKVGHSVSGFCAGAVSEVTFADARHGFAFGPGLWRTGDGGHSWHRRRSPAGLHRAWVYGLAATHQRVYAVVSRAHSCGGPTGRLWLLMAHPGRKFHVIRDLGKPPYFSTQTAGTHGLITTGHYLWVMRPDGQVHRHRLPMAPCWVTGSSRQNLFATCGYGSAGGGMGRRHAYGSTDGGRSWNRLPNPGQGGGYDDNDTGVNSTGHAIIGTISAAAAAIRVTTDYAASWHTARKFTNTGGADLTDAQYVSSKDAFIVYAPWARPTRYTREEGYPAHGRLYRTRDGGANWHRVRLQ